MVKPMNTLICILAWLKLQDKKDLMKLQIGLKHSQKLSVLMQIVTKKHSIVYKQSVAMSLWLMATKAH